MSTDERGHVATPPPPGHPWPGECGAAGCERYIFTSPVDGRLLHADDPSLERPYRRVDHAEGTRVTVARDLHSTRFDLVDAPRGILGTVLSADRMGWYIVHLDGLGAKPVHHSDLIDDQA